MPAKDPCIAVLYVLHLTTYCNGPHKSSSPTPTAVVSAPCLAKASHNGLVLHVLHQPPACFICCYSGYAHWKVLGSGQGHHNPGNRSRCAVECSGRVSTGAALRYQLQWSKYEWLLPTHRSSMCAIILPHALPRWFRCISHGPWAPVTATTTLVTGVVVRFSRFFGARPLLGPFPHD